MGFVFEIQNFKVWRKARFRHLTTLFVLFLISPPSWSAQQASPPRTPRLRTLAIIDFGSNLFELGAQENRADSSLVLIPSYEWNADWTIGFVFSCSKELTGFRELHFFDPSIRLSHSTLKFNPYLGITPSFGVVIPATTRSRDQESLVLATRPAFRFELDLSSVRRSVIRDFSAMFEVSILRAFHQFETSSLGGVNTQWRSSSWARLSYSPNARWSFSSDFIRNIGWSYQGNTQHSFSLGQTLSYQVSPKFSASLGHTNEGDVLRANGLSSNIRIFDPISSRVFTSFTVAF